VSLLDKRIFFQRRGLHRYIWVLDAVVAILFVSVLEKGRVFSNDGASTGTFGCRTLLWQCCFCQFLNNRVFANDGASAKDIWALFVVVAMLFASVLDKRIFCSNAGASTGTCGCQTLPWQPCFRQFLKKQSLFQRRGLHRYDCVSDAVVAMLFLSVP
jgi:hypothetical protein